MEAGGADFGAALMRRPERRGYSSSDWPRRQAAPVSVKCRVGTHERTAADGSLPADSYEPLADFVHEVTRSAQSSTWQCTHARPSSLASRPPPTGVPPLRPELARRLAADFPDRITVNGGIDGLRELRAAARMPARPDWTGSWEVGAAAAAGPWAVQSEPRVTGLVARWGGASAATRAAAVRGYARQAAAEVARSEAAVPEALAPLVLVAEQLRDEWRAEEEEEEEEEEEQQQQQGNGHGDELVRLGEDELDELVHAVCDGAAAIADRGQGASS